MPRTVTATPCTKQAFLAHRGERFEIVRYWDGTCYVNRFLGDEAVETPAIPEFTGYGEISGLYASLYGIILPSPKDLGFTLPIPGKQYAYAIIK